MTTMTFDKLAYVDRLRAAGFNEPQARAMADGLDQALREEVATKSDVVALRSDLKSEIAMVKSEIAEVRGEIAGVRGEITVVRGEIAIVKSDLLGAMKADKIDLLKWVVMLIVGQTAIFTALKLLGR